MRVIECESCAAGGEHRVPATTRSHNPEHSGYELCAECAAEYDSRMAPPIEPAEEVMLSIELHREYGPEDVAAGIAELVTCPDCGQLEYRGIDEVADHGKCRSDPDNCFCEGEQELEHLIEWYGADQSVAYVGDRWGSEAWQGTLSELRRVLQELPQGWAAGVYGRVPVEPGEACLVDRMGNAVLILA